MPKKDWWINAKVTGEEGEFKAINFLEQRGFKVIKRSPREPYDLIAIRSPKNITYAIQIKTGSSAISVQNIERLIECDEGVPAVLFVKPCKEKNIKEGKQKKKGTTEDKFYLFVYHPIAKYELDEIFTFEELEFLYHPKEVILKTDRGDEVRIKRT